MKPPTRRPGDAEGPSIRCVSADDFCPNEYAVIVKWRNGREWFVNQGTRSEMSKLRNQLVRLVKESRG